MANVIHSLVSLILTLISRFKLLILEAKRYTVCILPSGCTYSFHRSAACSLRSLQSLFSTQLSVFVRSIKDLNPNLLKIRACEAGSQTQPLFLPGSEPSFDRSDKISWLMANHKVATLLLEFVNKNTTPPHLL